MLVYVGLLVVLSACEPDSSSPPGAATASSRPLVADSMTIPRMLATDDRFSTLRAALDSTGLDSVLATEGPFTLFAPPDEAFQSLPPGTIETLLAEEPARLRALLARHVVQRRVSISDPASPKSLVTMGGDTLALRPDEDAPMVGEAALLARNVEAANGHLHVIDAVLLPPEPEQPSGRAQPRSTGP